MKRKVTGIAAILILLTAMAFAQTNLKEHKAGHTFTVGLPEYMTKTIGLNSASTIQYKSVVKDVYGFIIVDTKEDLALAEMSYSSLNEFYDSFITDFLADQENRKVSEPKYSKKGTTNFVECDVSYFDKEANTDIYYLVGIVETNLSYYKILSWSVATSKEKFKADFQKIIYSLKD
jgi:hypothetical protein